MINNYNEKSSVLYVIEICGMKSLIMNIDAEQQIQLNTMLIITCSISNGVKQGGVWSPILYSV